MKLQRARLRPAVPAVLAALSLVVTLGACGGDEVIGDEPLVLGTPTLGPEGSDAAPSALPQEQVESFDRIEGRVRRAHFPRPSGDLRRWTSTQLVTDAGRSIVRAAFPCEGGFLDLAVDSAVLAHAETVRTEGDFLVSQQLTVYPVGSRAGQFTDDLEEQPHLCGAIGGNADGKRVVGAGSTGFGTDRFFGVDDPSTLFAESVIDRSRAPDTHLLDVVTLRSNAVAWTRIVSERPVRSRVIAEKDRNPEWVEAVRTQGNLGVRALEALSPTRG